jgi:hypothetical protein
LKLYFYFSKSSLQTLVKILCWLLFTLGTNLFSDPFLLGEKLDYGIYLNGMRMGTATMEIQMDIVEEKNTRSIVFKTTAKSDSFLSAVYPVDDKMVSHYDFSQKRTISGMKKVREGKKHKEYHVDFDYKTSTASWWQKQHSGKDDSSDDNFKAKSGITTDLPSNNLDVLSAIYKFRWDSQELYAGSVLYFPVYDDLQVTLLSMEVVREENLDMEIPEYKGSIPTILIKPRLETSGFFRGGGEMFIWFSNDFRRIPLKIQSKVKKIGKIEVILEQTSGLANP